jgi:hypothetical protein
MDSKLVSTLSAALLLAVVLAPAPASALDASAPPVATNITDTPDGQRIKRDAIVRFERAALAQDTQLDASADYEVYTRVPGDSPEAIWVIPGRAGLPEITSSDGTLNAVFPLEEAPSANGGVEAAPPYVVDNPASCSARLTAPGVDGFMDRCGQWSYVANSTDRTFGHYAFKQWATCWTSDAWWLGSCELSGALDSTSGPAEWEDWAPRSDTDGACRSISLGISFGGLSVSGSYNGCERNAIRKGAAAGDFGSEWRGWVFGKNREAAYRVALKSPLTAKPLAMRSSIRFSYLLNRP